MDVSLYRPTLPEVNIDGRKLARSRAGTTARAVLAHDLESGAVTLCHLTRKQASAVAKVATGYIGAVAVASDDERHALERGSLSISKLHHRRRSVSDHDIERYLRRVGPDRVLNVLDQLTSPILEAAE